ncbi:hypothetical protein TNCT_61701 [Trichonephila clavata]|uniref:Uncharacterized protein n=1 Tax=Trichonephila clavata TaxID=2740835 RepID=A0A8X6HXF6_TRICU|nr:hypothetical protein TNCT_61701 [Trichonephila clavata]
MVAVFRRNTGAELRDLEKIREFSISLNKKKSFRSISTKGTSIDACRRGLSFRTSFMKLDPLFRELFENVAFRHRDLEKSAKFRKNSFAYKTETCAVTNSNLISPGRSRREEPENVFLRILAPNPGPRGGGPRKRSRAPRSLTGVPGPTRNLSRVELDEGRVPSDFRSPAYTGGPFRKRGPRSPSEDRGPETCGNFGLPIWNSCSPRRDRPDSGFPGRSRERSRLYSGKSASPLAAKRCISALSRQVSGIREKEKCVREAPEVPRRTSARSDPGVDRSAPCPDFSHSFPWARTPGSLFFSTPGSRGGPPAESSKKESRSQLVFECVSDGLEIGKKAPSAPLHGKVAARSGKGLEIRKGGTLFHPGCGFRRSRTAAGVQVGTLE